MHLFALVPHHSIQQLTFWLQSDHFLIWKTNQIVLPHQTCSNTKNKIIVLLQNNHKDNCEHILTKTMTYVHGMTSQRHVLIKNIKCFWGNSTFSLEMEVEYSEPLVRSLVMQKSKSYHSTSSKSIRQLINLFLSSIINITHNCNWTVMAYLDQ